MLAAGDVGGGAQVGAGAEARPRTGEDDDMRLGVGGGLAADAVEEQCGVAGSTVLRPAGPVQRDSSRCHWRHGRGRAARRLLAGEGGGDAEAFIRLSSRGRVSRGRRGGASSMVLSLEVDGDLIELELVGGERLAVHRPTEGALGEPHRDRRLLGHLAGLARR